MADQNPLDIFQFDENDHGSSEANPLAEVDPQPVQEGSASNEKAIDPLSLFEADQDQLQEESKANEKITKQHSHQDDPLYDLFGTDDLIPDGKEEELADSSPSEKTPAQNVSGGFNLEDLVEENRNDKPEKVLEPPQDKPEHKKSIEEELISQALSQPPAKPEHHESPIDPEFQEEEIAPGIGDEAPPDTNFNLPKSVETKTFPAKTSLAETVKLDASRAQLAESRVTGAGEAGIIADSIQEATSDDEDIQEWEGYRGLAQSTVSNSEFLGRSTGSVVASNPHIEMFIEDPTTYLCKLVKKGCNPDTFEILEQILSQLEAGFELNVPENPLSTLKHKEIVQILVYMVYVYLNIVDKLQKRDPKDKQQSARDSTILHKFHEFQPILESIGEEHIFAVDYFDVLISESKEKLHVMRRYLLDEHAKTASGGTSVPSRTQSEEFEKILSKIKYFWPFGPTIEAQLKVVHFELNRLYLKSKDFRSGYNILKKLIEILPNDIDVVSRFAKYCHFIGRNKESRKYYQKLAELKS
ncbi:unnamed protein product [Moneuplotes crassus]|uniref:Tetratricopeptide repeat protein n=1 Tax=Euplotes crassus TaxID=5936 RepID=A0AAD1U288_EUPCR|nr:unnamed protein product [Moneuplotes crassus]